MDVSLQYSDVVKELEDRMRSLWASEGINDVSLDSDSDKKKRYVLGMFPYPSGNSHLGHVLVYTMCDIIARLGRFKGEHVLNPLGWDSFGLPAENAAMKNGVDPADWTNANIKLMRDEQIGKVGFSFDLSHELVTSSPEFYKWTQWLFLLLHEHGQVYRAKQLVNWDPVDQTVLANEQVIDGKGWRSGVPIERREMEQWYLRITSYAESLWTGLDDLSGWSLRAKAVQKNWIGRSEGFELIINTSEASTIAAYTTRLDTIFGASSIVIAPEHPDVEKLTQPANKKDVEGYIRSALLRSDVDRLSSNTKTYVATGSFGIHPFTGEQMPIFISDYVLGSYGTGAIMSVPAHDIRDFEFSKMAGLPRTTVVVPQKGDVENTDFEIDDVFEDDGWLINSGEFTGLDSKTAREKIALVLEKSNQGKRATKFRLKDWGISRQRYWGCPIPMYINKEGEYYPVPKEALPVKLPPSFQSDAPNASSTDAQTSAVIEGYKLETDTMDTFMCSAWYAWRFLDAQNSEEAFPIDRSKYWMPIDYYVGGLEHASQHLIYFRYISHFLHEHGYTPEKEPVKHFLDNGLIKIDGAKMSKSKGNAVIPNEISAKYSSDALRLYILSDTPYTRDKDWDEKGVASKYKFLTSLYGFYTNCNALVLKRAVRDIPRELTRNQALIVKELETLAKDIEVAIDDRQTFHVGVSRIHSFFNTLKGFNTSSAEDNDSLILTYVLQGYLKVLGLYCPFIADGLWRGIFEIEGSIFLENWITTLTHQDDIVAESTLTVQINGKPRFDILVANTISDEDIESMILNDPNSQAQKYILEKTVRKTFVIRDRNTNPKLFNIVVK